MKLPALALKKPHKKQETKTKKTRQLSCARATCLTGLQSLQLKNVHQGRKFYLYRETHVDRQVTGAGRCLDTGLSVVLLP